MYKLTSVAYQTLLNIENVDCKNPLNLTGSALDYDHILKEMEITKKPKLDIISTFTKQYMKNYFVDFKLAGEMAKIIWKQKNNILKSCNFTSIHVT